MSDTQLSATATFEDILDQLERLGREHLLFYRVQVASARQHPREHRGAELADGAAGAVLYSQLPCLALASAPHWRRP